MHSRLEVTTLSVIVIVLSVIAVALAGGYFSSMNRDWYEALRKPSWQPPNWAFPVAWTTIFTLDAAAIVLIWSTRPHTWLTYLILGFLIANGLVNIAWSALFFGDKLIYYAALDAGLILFTLIVVMVLSWPISHLAVYLFAPYALWVAFATYLTVTIYRLNS